MNMRQFAEQLLDQCDEMAMLRKENLLLRRELQKYQNHVSEELQFWNSTYGSILEKLVNK